MEMFTRPILLLALALVLSIGIERLLELLRATRDHLEARSANTQKWQKRTEDLRNRIEIRLNNARNDKRTSFQIVLSIVCRYLSPTTADSGGLMAISVDKVRSMSIRVRYKFLAMLLGIVLAYLFQIDMFQLVNQAMQTKETDIAIRPSHSLGLVLSGMAMGFGAGPVHKIITALERARLSRR